MWELWASLHDFNTLSHLGGAIGLSSHRVAIWLSLWGAGAGSEKEQLASWGGETPAGSS